MGSNEGAANNDLKDAALLTLELHQHQFIQFSEQQEQLFHHQLPLMVSGPAGSGKTCMAMSMISNFVQMDVDPDSPKNIIYVTKSLALASQLERNWQQVMPQLPKSIAIQFATYNQLLPAELKLVDDELACFKEWFKLHGRDFLHPAELVWHEFRILSGLDDLAQYLGLGKKQNQLLLEADKRQCYALYAAYQKYLKTSQLCSPSLFKLAHNPLFDLLVVDEAQDLSYGQLANLNGLAKNASIVYFLGDHQLLFDVKSKLNFIKALYFNAGKEVSQLVLSQSYRCPPQVVELANCLIQTKYSVTGGLVDPMENFVIDVAKGYKEKPGQVRWLPPEHALLKSEIIPHAENHYFAVIVMDEQCIPEAADFFQCERARVFTPESIKGLEFKMVVVWKPLQSLEAKEVNKLLTPVSSDDVKEEAPLIIHRPKSGQANDAYLQFFNRLITAVTRCQESLIWLETEHARPIEHLIVQLRKGFSAPVLKAEKMAVSKQDDWQQLVMDYFYQDNLIGAREIFNKHLQGQYSNFEHFCQEHGLITAKEILPVKIEHAKAASAAASVKQDFTFEHALFNSKLKKEDWSYKSEIQHLIDTNQLSQGLPVFLKKFKSGISLDNFLFKDKCIKVIESKRKTNHYCFMDWLNTGPAIWLFVTTLANHTQILAKISISKIKQHLGPEHAINPMLCILEEIQELLHHHLHTQQLNLDEVLNPDIDFPVVHLLLRLNRLDLLRQLGIAGAVLEAFDHQGNTLLHAAAINEDYAAFDFLIRSGFDIRTPNKDKMTTGFLAVTLGDRPLFDILDHYKFDWHQKEENLYTPLQQAVRNGQLEMVDLILTKHPWSLDYLNTLMLYHLALQAPNSNNMFRRLLSFKINPILVHFGQKSVIETIIESQRPRQQTLSLLNDLSVFIESWTTENGFNLAHLAARNHWLDVIEWLCEEEKMRSLFLIPSKTLTLPIEEAVKAKSIGILEKLVSLGAQGGMSPEFHERLAVHALFAGEEKIIETLHAGGVAFKEPYQTGTLMHLAIRLNKPHLILALKKIGVDINQANEVDESPFLFAAKENKMMCLEFIFDCDDVNVTAQDKQGHNIFHFLAIHNQHAWIEKLLPEPRFKGQILKTNLYGQSPLALGVIHNHLMVVQTLLQNGVPLTRSPDKKTDIVYLAMRRGNEHMLKLMDDFKCNMFENIEGRSPIYIAIMEGKFESLRYFLANGSYGITPVGEYYSPLFMIASLGKIEFLEVLNETNYNFYESNSSGENVLHVLMKSDLSPITIKHFIFSLHKLGINIYYLLFQKNVDQKDPMFFLLDKQKLDVIEYVEELFHVLWPISEDEVETIRNGLPSQGNEDSGLSSTYGFINPAGGLAENYIKEAVKTGDLELIRFFVEYYMKTERHKYKNQHFTGFTKQFGLLEHMLWECVFIAIEHGQLEALRMLNCLRVPVDRLDTSYSFTSIEHAIRFKQIEIVKFLVAQCNVTYTKESHSLVHCAAIYDACEILRWFYAQPPLRRMFDLSQPLQQSEHVEEALPIMVAVASGSLNAVKTLKEDCGADLGLSVSRGYDALWFTVDDDSFKSEILQYLVAQGMDINKVYDEGKMTLLMKTAATGQLEALPVLVALGAKLDWVSPYDQRNILHYCVANNNVDYLKALMAYPIDVTHVDCNGYNVLHTAVVHSNFEVLEWMLTQAPFQSLVNLGDRHGRTPKFHAILEQESEMLTLFVNHLKPSSVTFFQPHVIEEVEKASEPSMDRGV
jgi:ankyrin repeat protein